MSKITITLETTPTDRRTLNNIMAHLEPYLFEAIRKPDGESVVISSTRYGANFRMKVLIETEGDHIGEPVPEDLKEK